MADHDIPQNPRCTAVLEYHIVGSQRVVQHGCLCVLQNDTVTVDKTLRLAGSSTGIENVQRMREGQSLEFELIVST